MKNTLLLIACLIFSGSLFAQSYEIDTYNGQTVSTCTGTFYDSGGPSGDYNNSEDYQVTFCSSIPGAQIMVEFTSFQAESPTFDNLTAYQGIGTGGTLIGSWGNNTLQGLTLESTSSGCITFVWHTDGSVIYPGWTANISCTFPCQDFTVDIVNTSIPYTSGDTIDLCQGQSITFTAAGTYPNNNLNYPQSDTTTTFQWDFGDGQQGTGQTITHTFTDGGGYFVTLNAYDVYNCDNVNYVVNMIRVSTTPTFVGTNIIEDTVCAGETINFNGFIQTEPWELAVPPPWAGTTFLPDDASGFYQTAITYEIFTPGQTLTDIYDIESLCLTMEHSYLGDLTLQLICPSGQTMTLVLYDAPQYPVSCGGTFLGVPIDDDGNLNPGTGYEYCWTPVATNGTIQDNCGGWGTTLPSGDYEPLDPWTNLLGCPLNGDWQIYIFDNLYSDNGYIFQWMIDFDPSIIPTNLWVFENSYNPADYIWSGNNITSQTNGVGTAIPMSTGNVNYTFTAIDDFGCSYDTTISVYVLSAGSPGCCSMPAPYAGANDAVCGYSYSLSATLTPGNTGTWSYTGPGTATFTNNTSQTTDVTVDTYGSYNFIWLEQNSPACSNADTVVITFNPTLSSDFSFSGIIPCYGDAVTVTYTGNATPAANYNWNFGAGVATGSGQGPYSVVFPSGTNQVSLSVSELGCSSNATIHTISAPDSLIKKPDWFDNLCYGYCQGWASMGVEGGTLPYSYNWAVNADTLYNLCAGPISVTVTDANGCTVSHAFIILEPTEISATTTANTAHCNQDDGNATVYPTGGTVSLNYDYLWDDPQHQTTQTASNLSSGIYFVTVADDNGCTFDTLVDVGNADGVVAIITAQTNVSCFGGNDGNATVTITGGTPNYFYQWSNGTTIATTNTSHSIYNLEADLYTVSVTDAYGCLDATYFEITQPPLLVATLTGVNVSCFGGSDGSTNLTVTGGTQPYTYLWNSGETTEDLTNIPTGNYVVTVTDEHLCSLFKSIIITQPAAPLSSSIITADVSCFGGSDGAINLSVAGGTPSYHYLWTNGDITQDINGIPIGTYFVTITDNNNCTLVNSATINQPDVLLYTTSYTDASCFGETDGTASIIASGGTLPYSYLWSNNIAGQNNSYLAAGTYFVTVTDAQGCTKTTSVTISEPDKVYISASPDQLVCINELTTISASATGGTQPYSYFWSNSQTGSSINVSTSSNVILFVYAMDASNCKSMLENVKIHVRPPITAELFVSDDTICRGDPVEFTVQASGGKPPYIYRLNDTIVTIPHVAHPPTTFNYLLVVSDSCGSPTGTDTDTVNVRELPAVNFTPDTTRGCPPLQIQFNLETSEFNCQKYWEFGDPGSLNSSTSTNPYHIFQNPGTYTVQVTITDQYGCVNSRKRENLITAYPNPTADFDLSPEVASITDPEITFTNFSQGHDFCFWNFGDNSEISNDCNPIHIYEEPGNYQIMLQVSTIYNCWDSIVYDSIPILDQFTFYIPTAFTPDDNDLNDVFRPFIRRGYDENTDHSKDFHFYIFDRWGLEIFETNDILEPWDGRVYGKEYARPGVYQWYIFYMDKEGNRHEECGSVTVIR